MDAARVPSRDAALFGFSRPATLRLPQPAAWPEDGAADCGPGSSSASIGGHLPSDAEPGLSGTPAAIGLPSSAGTLHFRRGDGLHVAVNLSDGHWFLPEGRLTLLRSTGEAGEPLCPDTAEWYRA
jgi:hypothetical protein